jgi:sodium transport system permease protein
MNWRNVRLIYAREIRDQLRDRRTLFMIAVLPLLLYPLLGMSVFQLTQFIRKSEPKVLVIGSEQLGGGDDLPTLIEADRFSADVAGDPKVAEWLHLEIAETDRKAPSGDSTTMHERQLHAAEDRLKSGDVQVVLIFPPDFGDRLHELREQVKAAAAGEGAKKADQAPAPVAIPEPQLMFNSGKEKSRVAHKQVEQILDAWKAQIVRENLLASRVPANVARPFDLKPHDVAERQQRQALMWSKVLPFVLFIWALTGAFYPAVDLCAGEKERGTLETLLSSPAKRIEIVWGKLLTVMTFSSATALLNLLSIGMTSRYVVSQLRNMPIGEVSEGLELPPIGSLVWLIAALIPMSAMFSALCLACAAFARSTKEGQYYLMPLFMVSMPLMMLPLAPGADLNLGNALIPITGVILLVMSLVQGEYGVALRYFIPVCGVTIICCHLAIRWAVYQFNQESVLFRESERLDPKRWLVHLVRDRRDTPTLAQAFFCIALVFVIQFFMQVALTANMSLELNFKFLAQSTFISQVVCFAVPAVMMALILTGRPAKSLLLAKAPSLASCFVAVLLAVLLHPFGLQLSLWIQTLYPVAGGLKETFQLIDAMLAAAPYWWMPYALMALLPAVCEELAFRGFILSGLRHLGSKWWAIGLTAVFFGLAHGVIQQSLSAAALGVVIGYIAVQTGSLIPCILFHVTYNSLAVTSPQWAKIADKWPEFSALFNQTTPGLTLFSWPVIVVCLAVAIFPLLWLRRLPYQATREEQISDARARQPHHPLPASAPSAAE